MACRFRDVARKYLVLVGCVMIIMPVSVSVYFGNFIIYISSYYYVNSDKVTVMIDMLWLSSAFKILQPIGMVLGGFVESKTKNLNTGIALGALMQSSSVILSYWAIREPLALLFTFGIVQDIAGGILLALPYKKAAEVFPEKKGFSFGILSTGPSTFPLLHMVLSYYLINPDNRSTDVQIGNIRYFTQADVINRVPSFFLKIGLFTAALQLSGFLLILLKKEEMLVRDKSMSTISLEKIASFENTEKGDCENEAKENEFTLTSEKKDLYLTCNESTPRVSVDNAEYESDDECQIEPKGINGCANGTLPNGVFPNGVLTNDALRNDSLPNGVLPNGFLPNGALPNGALHNGALPNGASQQGTEQSDKVTESKSGDLNPKEMLMSCSFWKTWLIFALMGHTFFIHLNLYKQFGLTVINNDNLLVMAGTVSTFVLMLFRPVVGILSDKFGMNPILVITCACANLFMTMMPISLYTFPPLYLVFVGLEFYAVSSVKVFYYMAPIILFGPTHFATNVGLMSSSQWVTFFVGPVIVPALIKSIGWTYVMMSGAAAAAIAFFLSVTLPESRVIKNRLTRNDQCVILTK